MLFCRLLPTICLVPCNKILHLNQCFSPHLPYDKVEHTLGEQHAHKKAHHSASLTSDGTIVSHNLISSLLTENIGIFTIKTQLNATYITIHFLLKSLDKEVSSCILTRIESTKNLLDFPFPFSLENTKTKDHCSPGTPDHLEDLYSLAQHHQLPHKNASWGNTNFK